MCWPLPYLQQTCTWTLAWQFLCIFCPLSDKMIPEYCVLLFSLGFSLMSSSTLFNPAILKSDSWTFLLNLLLNSQEISHFIYITLHFMVRCKIKKVYSLCFLFIHSDKHLYIYCRAILSFVINEKGCERKENYNLDTNSNMTGTWLSTWFSAWTLNLPNWSQFICHWG